MALLLIELPIGRCTIIKKTNTSNLPCSDRKDAANLQPIISFNLFECLVQSSNTASIENRQIGYTTGYRLALSLI